MGKMQWFIIAVSSICFLLFFVPLVAKGIINIGNITGIIVFGALIFYGFFMKRIHLLFCSLWQKTSGKMILGITGILIVMVVVIAAIETICMVRAAENKPSYAVSAVVLGCSVKGTRPSRVLEERLQAAYEYLQENPKAICILSGGKGKGESISEAQCMYGYLTERGIAPERLLLEDRSTSTEENLKFSKEILEAQGLGNQVAIITSEFHEYRAGLIAEQLGLEYYSVPGHTCFLYLPTFYVRELYGILQQWILK